MKIAFYEVGVTVSVGGVETAVWEIAGRCAERGMEVHIYGGIGDIMPKNIHRSIQVRTFPFVDRSKFPPLGTRFQRIMERFTLTLNSRNTLQRERYDIIFFTKPFDFIVPYLLKGTRKTRYAFISEGTDFFPGDRFLAKRIDYWFSCSHFNAWQLMSHYKKRTSVIYNGVDTNAFRPLKKDALLLRELSIGIKETVFIFAGRLVGWKGVHYIIEAMSLPNLMSKPVKFIIIGNGPEKTALMKKISYLDLSRKVCCIDFVSHHELPRYYSVADCAIYPSVGDEAFGISIAEAMACEKAVIASYCGGIPEIIGTGEDCGFLVPLADTEMIAEKMLYMVENPDICRSMGKCARKRISEHFTWNHSVDRLFETIGK